MRKVKKSKNDFSFHNIVSGLFFWCGQFFCVASIAATVADSLPVNNESVTVRSFVSQNVISLDQELVYTLEIEWNANAGDYDFSWPDPPRSDKLEVKGNSSSSQRQVVDNRAIGVKKFEFILKPLATGKTTIEPVTIRYLLKGSTTQRAEKTRYLDITIQKSKEESHTAFWLVGGLVVILLASGSMWQLTKKRKIAAFKKKEKETVMQEPLPEDVALGKAKELEKLLMSGDAKDYCVGISRILKSYLENKYKTEIARLLTEEIIAKLRVAELPDEVVSMAQRILELSDVMKFATSAPDPADVERIKSLFHNLLEKNKPAV